MTTGREFVINHLNRPWNEIMYPDNRFSPFIGQAMLMMQVMRLEKISEGLINFCLEVSQNETASELIKKESEDWNTLVEGNQQDGKIMRSFFLSNLKTALAISASTMSDGPVEIEVQIRSNVLASAAMGLLAEKAVAETPGF